MDIIKDRHVKKISKEEPSFSFIRIALSRGSIHGLKYLLDEKTTIYEK